MAEYVGTIKSGALSGAQAVTGGALSSFGSLQGAELTLPLPDPVYQEKTVTPTTSSQDVEPDEGYDALSRVVVEAMPNATLRAAKTIEREPSVSVDENGLVTVSDNYNTTVNPISGAGYVPTTMSYGVNIRENKTLQLGTVGATTYDPNDTTQVIASGQFITGNQTILPWNWMGISAEKVTSFSYSSGTIALKNTGFNGWTPSTTAKTITSSANAGTFTSDFANYEYVLKWSFKFKAAYNTGATLKNQTNKQTIEIYQTICKRPNSVQNINSATFTGNACITYQTVPLIIYYGSTTGTLTYSYTGSYGIYCAATAATFANSTADSTTVTIKTPAVSARCSTTYMATARASELDQENSVYTLTGELWRYKKNGALEQMYRSMIDFHNAT